MKRENNLGNVHTNTITHLKSECKSTSKVMGENVIVILNGCIWEGKKCAIFYQVQWYQMTNSIHLNFLRHFHVKNTDVQWVVSLEKVTLRHTGNIKNELSQCTFFNYWNRKYSHTNKATTWCSLLNRHALFMQVKHSS